jgi:chorismate mutase
MFDALESTKDLKRLSDEMAEAKAQNDANVADLQFEADALEEAIEKREAELETLFQTRDE